MTNEVKRYVVEIDIPDGYISIDCDIEYEGTTTIINLFLNQSSLDYEKFIEKYGSDFIKKLLGYEDLTITTERADIEEYLNELLVNEFGIDSDILIRDVDLD